MDWAQDNVLGLWAGPEPEYLIIPISPPVIILIMDLPPTSSLV